MQECVEACGTFSFVSFRVAFVGSSVPSGRVSQQDPGLVHPNAGPGLERRCADLTLIECRLTLVRQAFTLIGLGVGPRLPATGSSTWQST